VDVAAGVGDGRIASASRRDYAEAAAIALIDDATTGRTYELSGDVSWDQQELADAIAATIGGEVTLTNVTSQEHRRLLVAAGLDEGTAGFIVALDTNTRDGLLGATTGELSSLIGHPTTTLAETLREALDVSV
jgi:NAD(P)H dehydrogenase (quinone)